GEVGGDGCRGARLLPGVGGSADLGDVGVPAGRASRLGGRGDRDRRGRAGGDLGGGGGAHRLTEGVDVGHDDLVGPGQDRAAGGGGAQRRGGRGGQGRVGEGGEGVRLEERRANLGARSGRLAREHRLAGDRHVLGAQVGRGLRQEVVDRGEPGRHGEGDQHAPV